MQRQEQHPTQAEIIVVLIALAILVVGEALIYAAQQLVMRCGSLCGVLFYEPLIRMIRP